MSETRPSFEAVASPRVVEAEKAPSPEGQAGFFHEFMEGAELTELSPDAEALIQYLRQRN